MGHYLCIEPGTVEEKGDHFNHVCLLFLGRYDSASPVSEAESSLQDNSSTPSLDFTNCGLFRHSPNLELGGHN